MKYVLAVLAIGLCLILVSCSTPTSDDVAKDERVEVNNATNVVPVAIAPTNSPAGVEFGGKGRKPEAKARYGQREAKRKQLVGRPTGLQRIRLLLLVTHQWCSMASPMRGSRCGHMG